MDHSSIDDWTFSTEEFIRHDSPPLRIKQIHEQPHDELIVDGLELPELDGSNWDGEGRSTSRWRNTPSNLEDFEKKLERNRSQRSTHSREKFNVDISVIVVIAR